MSPFELEQLASAILIASGANKSEADTVAEILVWCDMVGRSNQGVWRLPILSKRLKAGLFNTPCTIKITMKTPSLGQVDANNGMGHFVGHEVMSAAITVAKQQGLCAMAVKNSNFYGAGGYYVKLAADAGMIGIALSNSFPKVVPYGGDKPVLGTNPLAFACPALTASPLILDMATSEQAGSTVRKAGETGKAVTDNLQPFGGAKGYGLALMVEILSGVMTGGGFSHEVKSMYNNFTDSGNNGHFFLVLDLSKFVPGVDFKQRMTQMIDWLKISGMAVQYPGEARWKALEQNQNHGITLDMTTIDSLKQLANELDIENIF